MSAPFDPSDEETWRGGFYEAAIVLGAVRDIDADVRLRQALSAVWRAPAMQAWSMDRWRWDWSTPLALATEALTAESHIYGVIDVPSVGRLPVVTLTVREEEGDDWLYVGVPLGGVPPSEGYPAGNPDETRASQTWREPLERALAEIVLKVCEHVAIQRAAIGWEIAGFINTSPTDARRFVGLIEREGGAYRYWPTTAWA